MMWYLRKKHKQFQDYREIMLPKLLKCLLSLLIGFTVGQTVALYFTQTRTVTIVNAQTGGEIELSAKEEVVDESLPASQTSSEEKVSAEVKSEESNLGDASIEEMIEEAFHDPEMLAIAKAESKLNPKAHNKNRNGTIDTGIFQINSIHGYDEKWLQNPGNNIQAAKEILKKQGKQAWVTWNFAKKNNLPI